MFSRFSRLFNHQHLRVGVPTMMKVPTFTQTAQTVLSLPSRHRPEAVNALGLYVFPFLAVMFMLFELELNVADGAYEGN